MNKQTEALKMADGLAKALDEILNGTLLDKHNRNDDGMIDARQWNETEKHISNWIKTAQGALLDYKEFQDEQTN